MNGRWPWPGDTPTERARRIANSLLGLLPATERPVWTARAHTLGETWLGDSLVIHEPEDAITGLEAAAMLNVSEAAIRKWATVAHPDDATRPLLPRAGWAGRRRTYVVADLLDAARIVRLVREEKRREQA
jgi:hypothetical protein